MAAAAGAGASAVPKSDTKEHEQAVLIQNIPEFEGKEYMFKKRTYLCTGVKGVDVNNIFNGSVGGTLRHVFDLLCNFSKKNYEITDQIQTEIPSETGSILETRYLIRESNIKRKYAQFIKFNSENEDQWYFTEGFGLTDESEPKRFDDIMNGTTSSLPTIAQSITDNQLIENFIIPLTKEKWNLLFTSESIKNINLYNKNIPTKVAIYTFAKII